MAQRSREEGEKYRIEYDEAIDAVVFEWTEFASGAAFREGANALLEYFRRADTDKVLVDSGGIEAHDDEDQRWLEEEWTPEMIEAGMEYNCVVHPEGVIAEMDVEELMEQLEDLPYEAHWTSDEAEARQWLADQP